MTVTAPYGVESICGGSDKKTARDGLTGFRSSPQTFCAKPDGVSADTVSVKRFYLLRRLLGGCAAGGLARECCHSEIARR